MRPWTLIGAVAVALAAIAPAAPAAPSVPGGPDPEPPTGLPNRPPTVASKVAIAGRAELSRLRWSTTRDQYSSAYVNPASWQLNLDGCDSRGGTDANGYPIRIRSYAWLVEPLDGHPGGRIATTTSNCRSQVTLPALGRWHTELAITTADNRVLRSVDDHSFRDVVIVAFGDSYVSGEGNPDKARIFDPDDDEYAPPEWTDYQCHRSRHSWAMRAARAFEGPGTTVTFLNYACSGAKANDLVAGSYRGIQPLRGDKRLPAQLVAAREALGNPIAASTRPVHGVLMSVGVNDAAFSSVLMDCAAINSGIHIDPIFSDPCNRSGLTRYVRNAIAGLRESYDRLEVGLAENVKGGAVRLVEYPSRVLTNERDRHGGCGIFEGIDSDEAHWITDRGDELNARMRTSAAFHGWRYVRGVRDDFRGHGYCAGGRTWFRSFSGSDKLQGNVAGTAHPLGDGHSAVARLVAPTIPPETPPVPPPARLRIEFTRVRCGRPRRPRDREAPGEGAAAALVRRAVGGDARGAGRRAAVDPARPVGRRPGRRPRFRYRHGGRRGRGGRVHHAAGAQDRRRGRAQGLPRHGPTPARLLRAAPPRGRLAHRHAHPHLARKPRHDAGRVQGERGALRPWRHRAIAEATHTAAPPISGVRGAVRGQRLG
jgi:hypothetical protein